MTPKRLTLATPCAACPHPYNWHTPGGCQADDGTNRCGCIAFAVAAEEQQKPARHTVDTITDDALDALYEQLADAERRIGNLQSSYATLTDMARSYSERAIENGQRADQLRAQSDRARATRNDYARRLDRVLNAVNPVADTPLPTGYDDAERAVRDYAREIRAAIEGPEPCEQHPSAPRIAGLCGACTQYPADLPKESRP